MMKYLNLHFQKDETFKSLKISNVRTLLQPIMTNSTTDFNELVLNFRKHHYDTCADWFKSCFYLRNRKYVLCFYRILVSPN